MTEEMKKEQTAEEAVAEETTGTTADAAQETEAADTEEKTAEETKDTEAAKEKKKIFSKKKDKKDEKIEELTDQLKRQMAEFDNYRKRTEKEKASMYVIGAKDDRRKASSRCRFLRKRVGYSHRRTARRSVCRWHEQSLQTDDDLLR